MSAQDRKCIREKMENFLLSKKGYSRDDFEIEQAMKVVVGTKELEPILDLIIRICGRRFIAIKCSPGSIVSREMEALCMARIFDAYQIPYSVVTNGSDGELLDTVTGKVVGGLDAIPSKVEALRQFKDTEFKTLSPKRADQAKRVLLASDVVKCPEVCDY